LRGPATISAGTAARQSPRASFGSFPVPLAGAQRRNLSAWGSRTTACFAGQNFNAGAAPAAIAGDLVIEAPSAGRTLGDEFRSTISTERKAMIIRRKSAAFPWAQKSGFPSLILFHFETSYD